MSVKNIKQEALQAIERLADDADYNDIMYCLYVLDGIHQGMKAIEEGDVISNDDLKREMEQW